MQIIPAIDIIDGKCVRLTQGNYHEKKVYNEHPLEVALQFQDAGLKRLHLVDLDGAKAGAVKNWKVLETIAAKTNLIIDFGGGINDIKDVDIILNSGATYVTVGSIAVKNEKLLTRWLEQFNPDRFLLGADVKDEMIAINGWQKITDVPVLDHITRFIDKGINKIFCTDISKDGKLEGPSIQLYKKIIDKFQSLFFIASGGVSGLDDVEILQQIGCSGVIIGKAIYENKISLKDLEKINNN